MTLNQSALLQITESLRTADGGDVMRQMLSFMLQALVDAEATSVIGAAPHQRTEDRVTHRNGARAKTVSTTAGDLSVRIPKLRQGSFFPTLLEPRLEGVPIFTRETLRHFKRADGRSWTAAEVAASTSVYAKPAHPHKRARPNKAGIAPLFTFRLRGQAKAGIRRLLADTYGYSAALIYPDIQGLSDRLKQSDWLPTAPG